MCWKGFINVLEESYRASQTSKLEAFTKKVNAI